MRDKITTTEAKAKELRPFVERWITRGKVPTLASRRMMFRLFSGGVVKKIESQAQVHIDRKGGYTRIIKVGKRHGDDTRMAILELVK